VTLRIFRSASANADLSARIDGEHQGEPVERLEEPDPSLHPTRYCRFRQPPQARELKR
jgi:hypothetical protein